MAIDDVLESIDKVTVEMKKKYPKGAYRVRIANAKSLTSYSVEKSDIMKWHITFLENLRRQL
jgi:hypothetical protein